MKAVWQGLAPRLSRGLLPVLAAMVLVGCAAMPQHFSPGMERAEIERRMGRPTAEYALPDGVRLQYSGQPSGRFVHNLDLDTQGGLRSSRQSLDESYFLTAIQIGAWTRDDVRRAFGAPALVERVARFDGDIWTYRYEWSATARLLHVHLDPAGVVRQVMVQDEHAWRASERD